MKCDDRGMELKPGISSCSFIALSIIPEEKEFQLRLTAQRQFSVEKGDTISRFFSPELCFSRQKDARTSSVYVFRVWRACSSDIDTQVHAKVQQWLWQIFGVQASTLVALWHEFLRPYLLVSDCIQVNSPPFIRIGFQVHLRCRTARNSSRNPRWIEATFFLHLTSTCHVVFSFSKPQDKERQNERHKNVTRHLLQSKERPWNVQCQTELRGGFQVTIDP